MSGPDRRAEAQRWLQFAGDDLLAARSLMREESALCRHVCWLAQQAAEKALKAILVLMQIEFPKTHDLDVLLNLIPTGWKTKDAVDDLAELTEWAVEARYPGDWPDATMADAKTALQQADRIWSSVTKDLEEHGVTLDDVP